MCVCVCVCVCARARACIFVRSCARVRAPAFARALACFPVVSPGNCACFSLSRCVRATPPCAGPSRGPSHIVQYRAHAGHRDTERCGVQFIQCVAACDLCALHVVQYRDARSGLCSRAAAIRKGFKPVAS